ncbi:hypothetical protein [Paenibacillus naphthalenovorans]|uniref:hypothetical protein n=1 Tax=Paenibacillus naphthalenovorans TaxID=162209 RepID=UPI0010AFE1D0|nr:hypothetical protein [Paenibacillus naphthalenovorans]GCL71592.1 hypothetical protein PN4B1_14970 [Paenibacillus naphthalenovorans]
MNWIAKQLYYKVQRQMTGIAQITEAQDRWMYLYEDKVVTHYREFPIHEVFDISYRKLGGTEGILYLHTKQGVYSYMVKADPSEFVEAFKQLESSS